MLEVDITVGNDLSVTTTYDPTVPLASGADDDCTVIVNFESNWDSYTKEVVFYAAPTGWPRASGTSNVVVKSVAWDENGVTIPYAILANAGYNLYIGGRGTLSSGAVATSKLCFVCRIDQGANPEDGDDIGASQAEQIKEMLEAEITRAETVEAAETARAESAEGTMSENLRLYNAVDAMPYIGQIDTQTLNGITVTNNGDGSYYFAGTSTAATTFQCYYSINKMPSSLAAGRTYDVSYTSTNVTLVLAPVISGTPSATSIKADTTWAIPSTAAGLICYFTISKGVTVNETVHPIIRDCSIKSNEKLTAEISTGVKSPFKLTFTGSSTAVYDGSEAVTVNIPSGGGGGGGAVDSVNGQTGVVVLTAEDVGALPDTTVIPADTSARVAAIEANESTWDGKQDSISDLSTIRAGAAKGATALQSVPSTYRTAAAQDTIDSGKQDTISDLSTIRAGATRGNTLTDTYINNLIDAKITALGTADGGSY